MEPVRWDDVDRVDRAAAAFSVRWLEQAEARFGDPQRLALARFGPVVAATAPASPDLDFMNRVYGLRPQHAGLVPAIVDHYRSAGLRPWFEVPPHPDFGRLADALTRAGCDQIGVYSGLAGPTTAVSSPASIDITPTDDGELFADLRVAGHEIPPHAREAVLDWPNMEGLTTYVARLDGTPAGSAALFLFDGVGYLADASTLPGARGHGVQAALIARRVADAHHAGCDLVGSLAAAYSTSQRNLERGGLRLAYQLSVWRAHPSRPL